MGLFTKEAPSVPLDQATADALRKEIGKLQIDLEVKQDEVRLTDEVNALKKEKVDLEVEKSKTLEDHEKKIREVEHKVGLQQQKAEQDQEVAVERAKLEVEKANLSADKDRFEGQMKFEREHLQGQVASLESMVTKVMSLVPQTNVNHNINEFRGSEEERQKALNAGTGEGDSAAN